eukprot:2318291-Rhodomonas_salina.2
MPRRSRDTGSRDQSPRPRDRRSRAGHVTCGSVTEQIDQPENGWFASSQGPRRKLSALACASHGAGGERPRESAQRATKAEVPV